MTDRDDRQKIIDAHKYMEAMFGNVREAKGMPAPKIEELKPVRKIVNRSNEDELEGAVMSEITHLLQVHPFVTLAIRANSGSAQIRGKNGKDMPIWFNRFIKGGADFTVTDFWGLARFGLFAIEAKRRDWTYTGTDREKKQKSFIELVNRLGGRAGFATSAAEAQNILEAK